MRPFHPPPKEWMHRALFLKFESSRMAIMNAFNDCVLTTIQALDDPELSVARLVTHNLRFCQKHPGVMLRPA